jgi:EpsD family peptidyl-prolyl cis-trans isomerase
MLELLTMMNRPPRHATSSSLIRLLSASTLCVGLLGCDSRPASTSQVAIRVNGDEVSVHQVELVLGARSAALAAPAASAAAPALLASLVDQELAAQGARQQGLDRDPQVIQQLEAARRQVLAQAYQDRIGSRAIEASSDEIDRYHDQHPELFAKRRLYQLQETSVGLAAGQFDGIKQAIDKTTGVPGLHEQLAKAGLKSSVRHVTISAEDVPLSVLAQLAALKEGESLVLPREGGARVLTLLGSQPAPLGREVSRRLIAQYLLNERKRELVAASIKALRGEAKVEYLGRYAALAAALEAQAAKAKP